MESSSLKEQIYDFLLLFHSYVQLPHAGIKWNANI